MVTTRTPATYADLEALPEHVTGEIVDGTLYVWPRPRLRHGTAEARIVGDLEQPFGKGRGGPGGWTIAIEPELHLGQDVLVPDVTGWRRERLNVSLDVVGVTVPPDWVCEILSPSTQRHDRRTKMRVYAEHGVPHLWLVDPAARTLEVYRHTAGGWLLTGTFADDERVRAEPFDAVELAIGEWWLLGGGAAEAAFTYG